MKKIAVLCLAACLAVCACVFAACSGGDNGGEPTHTHSFADDWSYDADVNAAVLDGRTAFSADVYMNEADGKLTGFEVVLITATTDTERQIELATVTLSPIPFSDIQNNAYTVSNLAVNRTALLDFDAKRNGNNSAISDAVYQVTNTQSEIKLYEQVKSSDRVNFLQMSYLEKKENSYAIRQFEVRGNEHTSNQNLLKNLQAPTEIRDVEVAYSHTCNGTSIRENLYRPETFTGLATYYHSIKTDGQTTGYQLVEQCDKAVTAFTVPQTYFGKPVVSIDENAFVGCAALAEVTIGSHITSVGENAFADCPVATATVPATLCTAVKNEHLQTVTVTDGTAIPAGAFSGCAALQTVSLPDTVETIGGSAFSGCAALRSFAAPQNLRNIGSDCFSGCSHLAQTVLNDGLQTIGDHAFSDCTSLTELVVPLSVQSVHIDSFNGCRALTVYFHNADSTYYPCPVVWNCDSNKIATDGYRYAVIDGLRFAVKDNAATVAVQPSGLAKQLGDRVVIPDAVTVDGKRYPVTVIYAEAFQGFEQMTSITIPKTVTSIGRSAFDGCNGLQAVHITDLAAWCAVDCSVESSGIYAQPSNPLYIAHNLYLNGKLVTDLVVPDTVTAIGRAAFAGCTSIKTVTVSSSTVGAYAFLGCELDRVNLDRSELYNYAFENAAIGALTFGKNFTFYGWANHPFEWCAIDSISVEYGNGKYYSQGNCLIERTAQGHVYLWLGCANSKIPSDVAAIQSYAFEGRANGKNITIPTSVVGFGGSAFYADEVTYAGTKSGWNSINKTGGWNSCAHYTVHCSDGDIAV